MSPNVVLVTGVGGELGGKLLARLGNNDDVERVIGVDTTAPSRRVVARMGRAEFVRADIRNPLIAKIVSTARVDTVVHASPMAHPTGPAAPATVTETNVIGTMRLLAACQRSPLVRKLVVKSTSAVYGGGANAPAVFDENSPLAPAGQRGHVSDAVEVEGYIRGLRRRRPDIAVTVARFSNLIGPELNTVTTRYFALPVVPSVLGYDARFQLLHASDALNVLELATVQDKPGVYNVSGDGVLTLSQAIRRSGRVELPVPSSVLPSVRPVLRGAAWALRARHSGRDETVDDVDATGELVDYSCDHLRFLHHGRVVDTTRLREQFGYTPSWTTHEAFDDFVQGRALRPVVDRNAVASLVGRAATALHPRHTPATR